MTRTFGWKFSIELKWGLIFSVMYLAWMVMERAAGFHGVRIDQQSMVGPLVMIPSFITYWLALRNRKRSLGGGMSYRQGLLSGCILTAFVVALSPLTQWLTSNVISPDYFANLIEYSVAQGALTREEAQQQFNFGNYLTISLVAGALTGVLFSAVLAAFTRSRNGGETPRHEGAA
jgi:hypothetical protein